MILSQITEGVIFQLFNVIAQKKRVVLLHNPPQQIIIPWTYILYDYSFCFSFLVELIFAFENQISRPILN